jgi:hypothetical protein
VSDVYTDIGRVGRTLLTLRAFVDNTLASSKVAMGLVEGMDEINNQLVAIRQDSGPIEAISRQNSLLALNAVSRLHAPARRTDQARRNSDRSSMRAICSDWARQPNAC